MENKIQELTEKLLNDGVEKGNAEAARIVSEAEAKAASLLSDAEAKAKEILANAQKEVQALQDNTKSEIRMYASQAVSALKSEIANVVGDKVVKEAAKNVVDDKAFMNEFILKLAEKWSDGENMVISSADAESLKALFASKAKSLLDNGVRIEKVNGNDASFIIQPENGAYKVKFGEEEFENYFKKFLRPQLVDMIF